MLDLFQRSSTSEAYWFRHGHAPSLKALGLTKIDTLQVQLAVDFVDAGREVVIAGELFHLSS